MSTTPYRILIVDDDIEDVAILRAKYARTQRASFVVDDIQTAEEALGAVKVKAYDAILIDLNLNGSINGLELIQKLSEGGHTEPVLIVTGVVDASHISAARDAGAVEILSKDELTADSIGIITVMAIQFSRADTMPPQLVSIARNMVTRADIHALTEGIHKRLGKMEVKLAQDRIDDAPAEDAALWEKMSYRVEQRPLIWFGAFVLMCGAAGISLLLVVIHPELVDILGLHTLNKG